jgi:uncharacterized protein
MRFLFQYSRMSKFIIIIKRNGLYQFILKDDHEETLLSSGGYVSKLNCESDILSIKENARCIDSFELKASVQGGCYFNIVTQDGYIVAKSELFSTEVECKKRIALIRKNAPPAKVADLAK